MIININNIINIIAVPCQTVNNGVCFVVIPLALNWSDAYDYCVILGGRVAEVTNGKINEDLKAFVIGTKMVMHKLVFLKNR